MEDMIQVLAAGGGGALATVTVGLKMLMSRLDAIQKGVDGIGDKVDKLEDTITDHEVRLRVMEKE